MSKKKQQAVPQKYKETPAQHRERVNAEGGRFRSRIETPQTVYNRKRDKRDLRNSGGD